MNGRFLLDTNVLIALLREEVSAKERAAAATEIFIPVIALGELYYRAERSAWSAKNIARIDRIVVVTNALLCDAVTARTYGRTRNALRLKGRPIPENDIWIAALALQHDLTVATRDVHFSEIEGIRTDRW